MSADNEAQELVFGAHAKITMDVAPKVQQDASPIRNREYRNGDVSKIKFFGGVILVVSEAIGLIVNILISAIF